jgi:succinate dehydrogenase/fumarate reductase flavoprotein subunit
MVEQMVAKFHDSASGRREHRRHPARAAGDDGHQRRRLPDRGDAQAGARDIGPLRERYDRASIMDKGRRYNTELLEAIELGFLLELAEVLDRVRAGPQREPRRSLPRGLPDRDDANFMRHTMAYRDGNDIRSTTSRSSSRATQPMERKY